MQELFDTAYRVAQQKRWEKHFSQANFFHTFVAEQILESMILIKRPFEKILLTGDRGEITQEILCQNLPFLPSRIIDTDPRPECAYDTIISVLELHYDNDLLRRLTEIRDILAPDGVFIGVLLGEETLMTLRDSFYFMEQTLYQERHIRFPPLIAIKDMGMILQKTGFTLPSILQMPLDVSYKDIWQMFQDIRHMGIANHLYKRTRKPLMRQEIKIIEEYYQRNYADEEGRLKARFDCLIMVGWSPHESQQKPSRPMNFNHKMGSLSGR